MKSAERPHRLYDPGRTGFGSQASKVPANLKGAGVVRRSADLGLAQLHPVPLGMLRALRRKVMDNGLGGLIESSPEPLSGPPVALIPPE